MSDFPFQDDGPTPGVAPGTAESRRMVLVVEDDPVVLESMREVFGMWGYHVQTAESGEAALAYCRVLDIDLVFTACQLSAMGGIELAANLRSEMPSLPVVCTSTDPARGPRALAAGASRFVVKPFQLAELRALAEKLITKSGVTPGRTPE